MQSYFIDPADTNAYREADGMPPLTDEDLNAWLATQDEETIGKLRQAREARQAKAGLRQLVHEKLVAAVPELYAARLPEELEARLEGKRYVLGFNQTYASDIDEARETVEAQQGISLRYHDDVSYALDQRFLLYDAEMGEGYLGADSGSYIAGAIEAGYYNHPGLGRFVAVFPEAHPEESFGDPLRYEVNMNDHILPEDMYTRPDGNNIAVNGKYLAGFIDREGDLWVNRNFCTDSAVAFDRYEPPALH
jgi:hypothetical protein